MQKKRLTSVLTLMMTVIIMLGALCLPASAATAMSKTTVTYTHNHTYTGKNIKPAVTVKHGKKKLTKDKHYTVAYKNYKNVGKGTITITGKGSYTGKVTKYFYISPKAVTNLKATAYAEKVKLTWSKVTGAKGYQVYQKVDGSWKKVATPTGTSATISGLDSATKYEFRVRAYAKAGNKTLYSSYKNISKSTTIAAASGLTVSDITESTASLKWNKVNGATSYRVTVVNTDTNYKKTLTSATNSIRLTSLDALSAYSVKVAALNVEKNLTGADSAVLTFRTAPAAVRGLTAALASDTVVNLSWTAAFGADGYQVYYSKTDAAGNPTTYNTSSFVTGTTCSLSNLTPCSTYIFQVVATSYTDKGTVYSGEAISNKITMPVPGVNSLKATTTGSDSVVITWSRPINIDGYKIYKDGKYQVTLDAKTTSYTLSGLTAGTSYKVSVCSYYGSTESARSEITVTTASNNIQKVDFNSRPASLKVGGTYQLSVTVTPQTAGNKNVTYTSSDMTVATVSSSGLITAKKEGTTVIKATSVADPNKNVSFTLTVVTAPVENIKVQSIALKSQITIYEGELVSLNPTVTPENATDKSFTITGSDYTYQYKNVWLITKTDTCKFSDYVDVYSTGLIKGKKATIEPKSDGNKSFSFIVTITTNDGSNKTASTKVTVLPKMIDVKYLGMEDSPWYYGNSAQLTATLHSTLEGKYKASDIRYKSSNTNIATVTNDGTVICKGAGDVTITAYIPNTEYTGAYSFYSRGVVSVNKNYYENCKAGQSYQLDARILPNAGDDEIVYYSGNTNIATVDSNGLVTFKKSGNVAISVFTTADPYNFKEIWLTSGSFTKPTGTNAQLLRHMKTTANTVKSLSNLPSVTRYDKTTMSNFSTSSNKISANDLQSIFTSKMIPKTTYLPAVSSSDGDYSVLKGKFLENIPVKEESYIIADSLSETDIQGGVTVKDEGDYFYEMKLVLKDETMSNLPAPNNTTRHGKVFDILTADYINTFMNEINNTGKLEVKYSSFSQRYYNCSLTLKVNKVTGYVENANFEMNIDGNVNDLSFKATGAAATTMDVSFTCNNIVNISFSSYEG